MYSFLSPISAQNASENEEKQTKLTFKNEYVSRVAFQGRDIGQPQWGFNSGLNFNTAGGFTASVGASYWSLINPNGIAFTSLGIGYNFDLTDWLSGSVGYERWFLNGDTTYLGANPNSNYWSLELAAEIGNFNFHHSGFLISSKNDQSWGYDVGLTYKFELGDWRIEPDVTLMSGTDNFSLTKRTGRPGKPPRVVLSNTTVYKLLNYELSLPITYEQKHWSATATFFYDLPQNPSVSEGVLPSFSYFSLGFNWILWEKAKGK